MSLISRLPGPLADHWDWQMAGACRTAEPSVFFHPDAERGLDRDLRDAAALQVCTTCPVITECREHALRVREPYGVWGGMTEHERLVALGADRRHRQRAAS